MKKFITYPLWSATLLMAGSLWAADLPRYNSDSTTTPPAGAPTSVNKASSLVGMEVRNNSDEKLGKIEDIVVDFSSGKIAYAVLNAGTLFKAKYLAVPANAFTPSADQKHLILMADKAKLETAKGFDKNMWPSVSNPDWGADTFWTPRPGTSLTDTNRPPIDEPYREPKPIDKN